MKSREPRLIPPQQSTALQAPPAALVIYADFRVNSRESSLIPPPQITADVRKGTRRDALLFSVSANAQHGHRRTNDDKRRAVDIMLNDSEWARWSDREIARQICVDQTTVSKRRRDLSEGNPQIPETRTVTRGGTTYQMHTANIGRSAYEEVATDEAVAPDDPQPEPPLI